MYFLFLEDYKACNLQDYEKYLSQEEKENRTKFLFQKDRDQYLLTRTMARKILAQRLGVHFSGLSFGKNQYGKPYLLDFQDKISFNISHSSGLIVLALSEDIDTIGIDVEKKDRVMDLDISTTVFTEHELLEHSTLAKQIRQERFFDRWTLKESYMKAVGKGFSLSPKSFGFVLEGKDRKFLENRLASEPEYFNFQLFSVDAIYTMAICYPQKNSQLNSFKILPYWEIANFGIDLKFRL